MSVKTLRYYYWLTLEFFKKHLKLIVGSFVLSFIVIIAIISVTPYLESFIFGKKVIIGLIGKYDFSNLPEEITTKISNGLIFINEKSDIVPALASSWEIFDNGKKYRFYLKDNLYWSNGKKFTARDIKYQFKDVSSKVTDDRTIFFQLKKPLPIFLTYLNKSIISYPLNGVAGLYNVEGYRQVSGNLVELSLIPNKKDLPSVEYKFFDTEGALIDAYKSGIITKMTIGKKSIADVFKNWKNTKVNRAVDYSKLLTLYFNLKNSEFKEREVRKAFTMAVDSAAFSEQGQNAIGPISPVSWAYNPNLKPEIYDPDAAEKTIKKTFSNPKTGSGSALLHFYTYYDYLDVADKLIADFKKAGVNIELNVITYENPSDFDFFLAYWKTPIDPDQYFFWHSTQTTGNISGYKNVKVDKLLEDGRGSVSLDVRKKYYFEFQRIIVDDPPGIFMFYPYIYQIERK